MTDIEKLVFEFMKNENLSKLVEGDDRRIYNEAGFQFELGYFFRQKGYNVFFERNIETFKKEIKKQNFVKKEIDLVLQKGNKHIAVELKYEPESVTGKTDDQHEKNFNFLKDICFMEQVKTELDFAETYCINLSRTEKYLHWTKHSGKWVYPFFRIENFDEWSKSGEEKASAKEKITSKRVEELKIKGEYNIEWHKTGLSNTFYYIVNIKK